LTAAEKHTHSSSSEKAEESADLKGHYSLVDPLPFSACYFRGR
jgi:hypothetical protein